MSAASAAASMGWSLNREVMSGYLGFASIVTWLGAQSPQIYENFKRGSVEGLALPFLVSWFIGDFTNFLGCVLTHQLPFQTYLAAYFLLVDVVLCGQFAYYSRIHPVPALPPFSEEYPYAQAHSPHHRHSATRSRSRKPRRSASRLQRSYAEPGGDEAEEQSPMLASWMTEGSGHSSNATASPQIPPMRTASSSLLSDSTPVPSSGGPPSPSQPERGRTLHRAAIRTFDPTLAPISGSPSSAGAFMPPYQALAAHNHVTFSHEPEEHAAPPFFEPLPPPHHQVPSRQRTSSSQSRPPVSRRSTSSIMFLSVGALLTLGRLGSSGAAVAPLRTEESGRVWANVAPSPPAASTTFAWSQLSLRPSAPLTTIDSAGTRQKRTLAFPIDITGRRSAAEVSLDFTPFADAPPTGIATRPLGDRPPPDQHRPHEPRKPDWERILGRTSAWTCTTAYLTSRLPQIWQNFRRRSVEGLAMTLFFFAFIGNSLYVASILTNPHATSVSYLLESLPYLLGSGGTVCFDLMILGQSWLYSEKRRARRAHERRKRATRGIDAEEEAALLHAGEETDQAPADARVGRFARDNKRYRKPSAGSSYRTATRSRSSSTLGYGRSVSHGGRPNRPYSMNSRSNSTELCDTRGSMSRDGRKSLSRAERGHLDDDPFEWDASAPTTASSPFHSRRPSIEISETIPEEGESNVTIRPPA
ncbi:hypothetical protein BMF94_6389 [Rhodotorula taiwanensis]|uniref:Uncharacterized protein n=1 Tax=Rhodotorula taiwanensis TaxID=741276 RepID=A0A2S5B1P7_9BASI|nr:hypothetical protein BMF94_6389 [Rhodotorula taiwanensis]